MQLFSNNASTTLAASLAAAATSMTVSTGTGSKFRSPSGGEYELITLTDGVNTEIVKCTARASDVLTITRAQESTTARDWSIGATVEARLTAGSLSGVLKNDATGTNALALGASTVSSAENCVAVGNAANAQYTGAIAIGASTLSESAGTIAVGKSASASGAYAIAVGESATTTTGIAIGYNTDASAGAIALGKNAQSTADSAITFGQDAAASAADSVAIGPEAMSSGIKATAVGDLAKVEYDYCVALGNSATAKVRSAWAAGTTYAAGQAIKNGAGTYQFVATTGFTSGGTEPTWDTTPGNTTADNGGTWRCLESYSQAIASQYWSQVVVGRESAGYGGASVAVGYQAGALGSSLSIGYQAFSHWYSVALGDEAKAYDKYCVVVGKNAKSEYAGEYGGYNTTIGAYALSYGQEYCVAIGAEAENRISGTNVISGLSLVRKDNGESGAYEHVYFTGSQAVVFSKEIDLKSLADNVSTIAVPTGTRFFPDEIGLIVTAADTVTGQPNVSFGITGNTTSLLASTATTKSAVGGRDIFTLLSKDGVASLTASVKTAATGTTLKGRFYWKGILLEDE